MDGETSGAVLDHETAEAERAEAERIAAEEALAADAAGETPDPGHPDENADNPGVGQEPGDEPASKPGPNKGDAPEVPDEPEDQGPQIMVEGSQLSLAVGGKKPTSATVRLTGGKVQIPAGQLEKGKAITVLVTAIVDDVGFKDLRDPKTKQIVGCERRHKAFITGTELLEQE